MPLGILFAALVASSQTVTLVGHYQGQEVGKATYCLSAKADGTFVKSLDLSIKVGSSVFQSRVTVRLAADGSSLGREEFGALNGKAETNAAILYDSKQATFKNRITGHSTNFARPKSTDSRDVSDVWFLSVRPRLGEKIQACSLTTDKGWQTQTVTYSEDRKMTVAGKSMAGHVLKFQGPMGSYERVLDDRGVPIVFEVPQAPGLVFTRS